MSTVANTQSYVETCPQRSLVAGRLPAGGAAPTVVFTGPLPGTGTTRSVVQAQVVGDVWVAQTPGSFSHASYRDGGRCVNRRPVS
ncbi:hypothetical protein [Streptomyces sp. NPDC005476]|uniref:hypothetical protein n=1 Tax=Streptomyces sp. NPDC005476 TaxID=3156882 RepID=UPI003454B420